MPEEIRKEVALGAKKPSPPSAPKRAPEGRKAPARPAGQPVPPATAALLMKPLSEWRARLGEECGCYVCEGGFIAKSFDGITYRFCSLETVRDIARSNAYALLRYKYFRGSESDKAAKRIDDIVKSFTNDPKSSLPRVSFSEDADCARIRYLDAGCVAFRNGVYDFRKGDWLFKYEITDMGNGNKLISYGPSGEGYAITWYVDINFEPLGIRLRPEGGAEPPEYGDAMSLSEAYAFFKNMADNPESAGTRCLAFELMHNMAHDQNDRFSMSRFRHLCEIFGYTLYQPFTEKFVMLVGAGGNGKNSIFDGCFTSVVRPRPASNSLEDIEEDRFITGALQNHSHNFFFETDPKTHEKTKMIKNLTGSPYQTIEEKGVQKYESLINCKYIFSGNDQDKIKFSDNTSGFRRRINVFELYYQWDAKKRFLRMGDYYDTTFSSDLREFTADPINIEAYIYFGMYGMMEATKGFTEAFDFTENDWRENYTDADYTLKAAIEKITPSDLADVIDRMTPKKAVYALFDANRKKMDESDLIGKGHKTAAGVISFLRDPDESSLYFEDHDFYVMADALKKAVGYIKDERRFNSEVKHIYGLMPSKDVPRLYANEAYYKCRFVNSKLRILRSDE